ncbi:PEP-CTERM sorting domain-containing protein [Mariniblastus fucicola]|uniref:PEP-CTERM protein-sorting domain-containing protein n=1 Tax=Mariniblastus fucicola TaxID=980251 RepID=A0A5B9P5Q5_9BACT|nr:PEP-CTERM sorting domain-containing protein [Mariniblastus fucicola]QEG21594.1 hypothetical protein MFFC18_14520 [Mariniblastus fucicola]
MNAATYFRTLSLSPFTLILVTVFASPTRADNLLGGLETYSTDFVDVTNQPLVGNWTKIDSPNPVVTQGELVTAGAFGSAAPKEGNVLLDLRTESQYASGGDGADYRYELSAADTSGIDPKSNADGTLNLSYWICPDTWSNDFSFFYPEGIYQRTNLLNGTGEILASIGMYSLGNQNAPRVDYSVDGVNWQSTNLQASNSTWTRVTLTLDMQNKTSAIGFTDANENTFSSTEMAWNAEISDTTVQYLHLQMDDGAGKSFFDDFQFTATSIASVPEPSTGAALLLLLVAGACRRRPEK